MMNTEVFLEENNINFTNELKVIFDIRNNKTKW